MVLAVICDRGRYRSATQIWIDQWEVSPQQLPNIQMYESFLLQGFQFSFVTFVPLVDSNSIGLLAKIYFGKAAKCLSPNKCCKNEANDFGALTIYHFWLLVFLLFSTLTHQQYKYQSQILPYISKWLASSYWLKYILNKICTIGFAQFNTSDMNIDEQIYK